MRVAAIYDIHGNLPALEAVLDEIKQESVDCIIVGGDVIAGPMPAETLVLLQHLSIPTHFIHGNAESELLRHLDGEEPQGFSKRADERTYWVAKQLTVDQKQFMSEWPAKFELITEEYGNVLFCHATPHNDVDIFTQNTPEEKVAKLFEGQNASLVVCGHTHMQFDRNIEERRVINAGSVGMPFGHTGADWLLIDREIEFRHTDYDIEKTAEGIRQSSYPYAEDFAMNNVLQPPSKIKALEMLSQLETKQATE